MTDVIESYEFQIVEPVKRQPRKGAGRRPAANPFLAGVRQVAGQSDERGPLTASAPFKLDEARETLEQRTARIRRFLTSAGKQVAAERSAETGQTIDSYSIGMHISETQAASADGPATYVVKLWDRRAGK